MVENLKFHLVMFADEKFLSSAKTIAGLFLKNNIRSIKIYDQTDLSDDFKRKNRDTLNLSRGAGYWIWKPWIILDYLGTIKNGDFLIYFDSGVLPTKSFFKVLSKVPLGDITLWESDLHLRDWTDSRVLEEFEAKYAKRFTEQTKLLWSGFFIIRKNENAISIIQEWEKMCENPKFLRPDSLEDYDFGVPRYWHRHDQSLLSIICNVSNLGVVKLPSTGKFGYRRLFDIHRKANLRSHVFVFRIYNVVRLRKLLVRLLPKRIKQSLRRLKAKSSKAWLSSQELARVEETFKL